MPENEAAIEIFRAVSSQLRVGGLGGVIGFDYASLPFIFKLYGVPEDKQIEMFEKLVVIFSTAVSIWNKKKA